MGGILLPSPLVTVVGEKQSDGTLITTIHEQMYDVNTNVQLKAIPASGYYFVRWKGTITDESEAENDTLIIPMTSTKQVTAIFTPFTYRLKINIKPVSGGQLTIKPALTADGYIAETKVTVTASANQGYVFSAWTGDFSSKDNSAIVTMNGDKEIIANFTQEKASPSAGWIQRIGIWVGILVVVGLVIFLLVRLTIRRRMPPKVT